MTLKTSEKASKNFEECLLVGGKKSKEYDVSESNGKVFQGGGKQYRKVKEDGLEK